MKLEQFRPLTTPELIESLRPGQSGALRTRADGTVLEGHHRLEGEAAAAAASGIELRSFPLPDRGVPVSHESVAQLASEIVDALETGRNVAVHCRQGIGRSALIVGGVLVAAGSDPRTALQTIEESRGLEVPETEEQREWLRDFASSLRATHAAAAAERRRGVWSDSKRS